MMLKHAVPLNSHILNFDDCISLIINLNHKGMYKLKIDEA